MRDKYLAGHDHAHKRRHRAVLDGRTLGKNRKHQKNLRQLILKHKPESILDYGCGKGQWSIDHIIPVLANWTLNDYQSCCWYMNTRS